jgi:phage tail sheath gpL-like
MAISNPKINIQIIPAVQEVQNEEQRILFLGQMTTGSATPGSLVQSIGNNNEQNALFGQGSILANMIKAAKKYNKISRMDAIPLADDGGAIAATSDFIFTVAATSAGILYVIVGSAENHKYAINVLTSDTPTTLGDKLEAAITADADSPVTASNAAGTVTLTAKNKGIEGNDITVKVINYTGGASLTVNPFASGATNPNLDNVLDVVANIRYQTVICPPSYIGSDTNNNIRDFLNDRWNPTTTDKILDGVGITTFTDTLANLKAATYAENSQNFSLIANRKVSETLFKGSALIELNYVIAAQFGAIRALRLTLDAPLSNVVDATEGNKDAFGGIHMATFPYHNTPFEFLPLIDNDQMWLDTERDELKDTAWTILGNNVANNIIIADSVLTRYKTNAGGDPDLSYKYLNYVDQASNVREYYHNNLRTRFANSRLTEGGLIPGYTMANAALIKAEIMKLYGELADAVLVPSGENARKAFLRKLEIEIIEIEGKVNITMLDPLITQLREIDATMQLSFSINT